MFEELYVHFIVRIISKSHEQSIELRQFFGNYIQNCLRFDMIASNVIEPIAMNQLASFHWYIDYGCNYNTKLFDNFDSNKLAMVSQTTISTSLLPFRTQVTVGRVNKCYILISVYDFNSFCTVNCIWTLTIIGTFVVSETWKNWKWKSHEPTIQKCHSYQNIANVDSAHIRLFNGSLIFPLILLSSLLHAQYHCNCVCVCECVFSSIHSYSFCNTAYDKCYSVASHTVWLAVSLNTLLNRYQ